MMRLTKKAVVVAGLWAMVAGAIILMSNANRALALGTYVGPADRTFYIDSIFRASHNSYCGNIGGHRGSIVQQLDAGIRQIELDIHRKSSDNGIYFEVGHDNGGDRVDHSHGNPSTNRLDGWLDVIASWSGQNRSHEPVLIILDPKDELTKKEWNALNNLIKELQNVVICHKDSDNNDICETIDILITPSGFKASEDTLAELKGKVFVRSGRWSDDDAPDDPVIFRAGQFFTSQESNPDTNDTWVTNARNAGKSARLYQFAKDHASHSHVAPNLAATDEPVYGWYANYCEKNHVVPDFGFDNVVWGEEQDFIEGWGGAVAINSNGFVVEVHRGQEYPDHLWYTTGKMSDDGKSINWFAVDKSHRQYDKGCEPTVAINDNNIVVEIHRSQNTDELWYRLGKLQSNGIIDWWDHDSYDTGDRPSVGISGNTFVEVHVTPDDSGQLWYNAGVIDEDNKKINWGEKGDYRNYAIGYFPAVAVNGNRILEAHNSGSGVMWCTIGSLNAAVKRIGWIDANGNPTHSYPCEESGSCCPTVALNDRSAVEVHVSYCGDWNCSDLWRRTGKESNTVMAWGTSKKEISYINYRMDPNPTVAMNQSGTIVLFYNCSTNDLCYRIGHLSAAKLLLGLGATNPETRAGNAYTIHTISPTHFPAGAVSLTGDLYPDLPEGEGAVSGSVGFGNIRLLGNTNANASKGEYSPGPFQVRASGLWKDSVTISNDDLDGQQGMVSLNIAIKVNTSNTSNNDLGSLSYGGTLSWNGAVTDFNGQSGNVQFPVSFVFGKPVELVFTAYGDAAIDSSSDDKQGSASFELSPGFSLGFSEVKDTNGNLVTDYKLVSDSGFGYTSTGTGLEEPISWRDEVIDRLMGVKE